VKISLKSSIFIAISIVSGAIVLLGYFVDIASLKDLRVLLLQWAMIITSVALVIGVINLMQVHWRKVESRQPAYIYSLILFVAFGITLVVAGYFGPTNKWSMLLFNYVQTPIESSLLAILTVVLVFAAGRLFLHRQNTFTLVFILTAIITLLGMVSFPIFSLPGLDELRNWIIRVWALAGARGILLGVALGIIATGLRILIGADRPYGG